MMASLNAFFNEHPRPVVLPDHVWNRNTSDVSESSAQIEETTIARPSDLKVTEKAVPLTQATSEASQKTESDLELAKPDIPAGGKQDPFAGGIEGGVTYQSMEWWYEQSLI
jgi:hypothetical protein